MWLSIFNHNHWQRTVLQSTPFAVWIYEFGQRATGRQLDAPHLHIPCRELNELESYTLLHQIRTNQPTNHHHSFGWVEEAASHIIIIPIPIPISTTYQTLNSRVFYSKPDQQQQQQQEREEEEEEGC